MIYITGDTHGDFARIRRFCNRMKTTRDDVMIILGDAGFNYYGNWRDDVTKKQASTIPITFFCIHGNHENRPSNLPDMYDIEEHFDGFVYVQKEYPNILFAIDGFEYNFNNMRTVVIGGAYSVDKPYRLQNGWVWFDDEQPDALTKSKVENRLIMMDHKPDVILSHTCPFSDRPVDMFLPSVDQNTVDNSTEEWLEKIKQENQYQHWYCGHYHTDRYAGKLRFLFNSIIEFPIPHNNKEDDDE